VDLLVDLLLARSMTFTPFQVHDKTAREFYDVVRARVPFRSPCSSVRWTLTSTQSEIIVHETAYRDTEAEHT
jgi:hypothetical protein